MIDASAEKASFQKLVFFFFFQVSSSNDDVPEYYFDHNYTGFINILDAYRTGTLHLNSSNCAIITREDLDYWAIDELLIEPCCAVR